MSLFTSKPNLVSDVQTSPKITNIFNLDVDITILFDDLKYLIDSSTQCLYSMILDRKMMLLCLDLNWLCFLVRVTSVRPISNWFIMYFQPIKKQIPYLTILILLIILTVTVVSKPYRAVDWEILENDLIINLCNYRVWSCSIWWTYRWSKLSPFSLSALMTISANWKPKTHISEILNFVKFMDVSFANEINS